MDTYLNDLNQKQKDAVLHITSPLIIFAGAGTGKTRVITFRIAHLLKQGVSPFAILAVTFTNKAAEEMRRRVDALAPGLGRSVWISTFHSFCATLLRVEAKHIGLDPQYLIYDTGDSKSVLRACIRELNLDEKKFKPGRILEIIGRSKDDLIDSDSYGIHALASGDYFRQNVATIYHLYQKKLRQAGALDFGDLLMSAVTALRDNEPLRAKYQERFRYIMVDEYQDTNHAQYILTKYLSAKHKNICVVGDDDQSIYSWRGADIRNILEFERDYPGCATVKLERNYRSTPNILESAWQVIKNNQKRVEKKLWTEKPKGSSIMLFDAKDELDEAEFIVQMIDNWRKKEGSSSVASAKEGSSSVASAKEGSSSVASAKEGFRLSDFAVFYRTNAQSRVLEDAFRRSGTPYKVVGTMRFYERSEVKDILAYLRLIHNPNDDVSFKRIVNVPRRGIGKTAIETLERSSAAQGISLWAAARQAPSSGLTRGAARALSGFLMLMEEMRSKKEVFTVKEMASLVLEKTGYIADLETEDTTESRSRIENIQELVSAIDEFERRSPDRTLAGYLVQVALVNDVDELSDEQDRVTLMTLHLAKGLEFRVVFVSGLEEGLFPIGESAFSQEELEEERRLMYVGMTRAKEQLYLSWAEQRRIFGKSRWNMASRFIEEASVLGGVEPLVEKRKEAGTHEFSATISGGGERSARHRLRKTSIEDHVPSPFPLGSRVRHEQFGEGKVIDKSGAGDDLKLVILFDTGQWKKLMVKYANLEKI